MKKKDAVKFIPMRSGEPVFEMIPPPNRLEDLSQAAIDALESALSRRDKTGCADKVAVDAAKFVVSGSSAKDSDEYKKMLSSFRELIMKSRKGAVTGEDKVGTLDEA